MIEKKTLVAWLKVGLPVLGAVLSIVAICVSLYTFRNQLETTNKHMEVNLSRDLIKDFYSGTDRDDLYRRIRMSIERCKHVYKSWGGDFDNDQIGRYLGFFEDLGLYRDMGVLDIELINYAFGSYIIEAWEYSEFQRYIAGMREKAKQVDAFRRFENLAKAIEADPTRREEVERARLACPSLTSRAPS